MLSRVNVLLTVPHLHSAGSPYREMVGLVRFLPQHGFDVTVAALRDSNTDRPVLERLGARVMHVRFRPTSRWRSDLLETLSGWRAIERLGPFPIQHSLDFSSSPIEAIGARLSGRKYVFNQKNMNEDGHARLLRAKISLAHRVIAISADTSRLVREHGAAAGKVVTIHNGIEPELLADKRPPTPSPERTVLCVGQLIPRKRQLDVIRSFALLLRTHPNARLQLAGQEHYNAAYVQELRSLCESLGIRDRVEFLGTRTDILALMRGAGALLMCSESEGVPWTVVEAMALKTPVVASDIPGNREIIQSERDGLLVPVGDVDGFAAALVRVFDERSRLSDSLVDNGSQRIRDDFTADRMAAKTAEVYRSLLAQPSSTSRSA